MRNIFYILILSQNIIFSQTATLDTNTILIGDQIYMKVTASFETSEQYEWPLFQDSVFNEIEIIKKEKIDTINQDSIMILSQKILITAFDSGTYYIPSFKFNEDKKSNEIVLTVNTILITDSSKMHDITYPKEGIEDDFNEEELEEIRKKRWRIFYWLLGILLLCFLVYYLLRRYKKAGVTLKKKVIIPPHITALNRLQDLKKKKLWQKGEIKEYYSILSTILREYTENRFTFNALEMPTTDIMRHLKRINIKEEYQHQLESVLRKSDTIKYAKGMSVDEENKRNMNLSIEFVKNTKIEDDRDTK